MSRDGGPAFPLAWGQGTAQAGGQIGMTLRDWFAGKAMAAAIAGAYTKVMTDKESDEFVRILAPAAYEFADAMIAERSKP